MNWFRSHQLTREVVLYVCVGLLGLGVDFLVFFTAQNVGYSLLVSQWIGATCGFVHNHIWHHYKVFTHSEKITKTTFWSLILSVISILATGPLLLMLQSIIPSVVMNKIFLIALMSIIQFIIRKFWVFKSKAAEHPRP